MGFFGLGIAFLLAFAVPASIAPASLVGAYVVLAVLGLLLGALAYRRRRSALPAVAIVVGGYAVIVAVIHFAAR